MVTDKEIIERATELYQQFMNTVGIPVDANSEGTAERYARMMYNERCKALRCPPPSITVFPADKYDEYVAVKDIPYYSMCAHHHVTFYGKAHVAYHPDKKVVGLSKIARIVKHFAEKPQIQEQLTAEIAEYLWNTLHPIGLFVKLDGRHLCMESRGVQSVGAETVTQKVMGHIDKEEVMQMFRRLD